MSAADALRAVKQYLRSQGFIGQLLSEFMWVRRLSHLPLRENEYLVVVALPKFNNNGRVTWQECEFFVRNVSVERVYCRGLDSRGGEKE